MKFFLDFLRQKAPVQGAEMPAYYRNALAVCEKLLTVYFPLVFVLFGLLAGIWSWVPAAMLAATVASLLNLKRMSARQGLAAYAGIVLIWAGWYIWSFGWGSSIQLSLFPVLMLVFFDIYESPPVKVVMFVLLVAYRVGLYVWSIHYEPVHIFDRQAGIVFQFVNSVICFISTACLCILFSSNTQATERQLRIANQTLHKAAGTDPLTQLPNRRTLTDEISLFLEKQPDAPFGVAIADIDFFKHVNDTYGHQCGDYTLKQLADLFRESAGTEYRVCRWGGEEFCFFLPGKNLDEAADDMNRLCSAVRRMELSFEGHEFKITITIGVAENDFRSPVDAILEEADRKLYLGKNNGRNQVVV